MIKYERIAGDRRKIIGIWIDAVVGALNMVVAHKVRGGFTRSAEHLPILWILEGCDHITK